MTMRVTLEDRPWYQLTTHFFRGLFDFGILSDAGADAFRRMLIGIVAVMVSLGLLLTRMYLQKYTLLSEMFHDWGSGYKLNREPYQLAVLGDGALVIAFPMLIVGLVVVLVSNSLFPSVIDCRVLLPLGVSKRVVFASKALAVMVFASVFAIATHAAMIPLVIVMWNSRWADRGLSTQLAAHGVASLSASIATALVIIAITGVLLICVPRSRVQVASIVFRGVSLCALVLSIPLAFRLPTTGGLIASESPLFYLAPPVWFLGIEQWLLGKATPYFLRLAQIAAMVGVASLVVAVGSYLFLYHQLERVIFPAASSGRSPRQRARFLRLASRKPNTAAVGPFIRATLTRSPLHQGILIIVAACGAALVLNGLVGNWHARAASNVRTPLGTTVIWAAFVLVFTMNVAVRAALVFPVELRANWIFRMTEDEATRAEELSTVVRTLIVLGVVVPLVILFPLQWAVLGWRAIQSTSIAGLCGLVLVELHMTEWRRIPFTCSYEPGRQLMWQTIVMGIAAFVLFTTIGPPLAWYSTSHPRGWLVMMTVLCAVLLYLRRQRLWMSRRAALMFEDVLPTEVEPLKLSEY
ncbi:MAG TPA: hypothetical protein VFT39_04560 [Vicinamibacterales bacterium]|nr:hypothetical protein [Vicinamibacterales bacterium]